MAPQGEIISPAYRAGHGLKEIPPGISRCGRVQFNYQEPLGSMIGSSTPWERQSRRCIDFRATALASIHDGLLTGLALLVHSAHRSTGWVRALAEWENP